MSQRVIETDVKLELRDVIRYNYWSLRIRLGVMNIVAVLYLLWVWTSIPSISFTIIVLMIVANIVPYYRARRTIATHRLLQQNVRLKISDEGIQIQSESGNSVLKWNEIYKIGEAKYFFAIYLSNRQAVILPKRVLNNDLAKIDLLKDMISTNMDSQRVKLKHKA